jgi:hypothetical protein
MREYHLSLDQTLNMGYFEAHRLWMIGDELRHRDLQLQSLSLDYQNGDKESRTEFLDWIKERQPRRFKPSASIPEEVRKMLEEVLNG